MISTLSTAKRSTRQRNAIRDVVEAARRPVLADEILELARQQVPQLSLATVYRNLKQMVEEGELVPVLLAGENPRYELPQHGHHHHFHCRVCGRVDDIHACPGDLGRLVPPGFVLERHDITLHGVCPACSKGHAG